MKIKAAKSLKIWLFIIIMLTVNLLFQVISSLYQHRPTWIIIAQLPGIPVFIFLYSNICLDLFKKDIVSISGRLIEKKLYRWDKVHLINVLTASGKIRKFRYRVSFIDLHSLLKIDQTIEVSYYKRTNRVTAINDLNN